MSSGRSISMGSLPGMGALAGRGSIAGGVRASILGQAPAEPAARAAVPGVEGRGLRGEDVCGHEVRHFTSAREVAAPSGHSWDPF